MSSVLPIPAARTLLLSAASSDLREWLLLAGTTGELENLMASAFFDTRFAGNGVALNEQLSAKHSTCSDFGTTWIFLDDTDGLSKIQCNWFDQWLRGDLW
jgi:hypothetical protein